MAKNRTLESIVKKLKFVAILVVLLLFVSCDEAGMYSNDEFPTDEWFLPFFTIEDSTVEMIFSTDNPNAEAFAYILNAYAWLEHSGFTALDANLIGHSYLAEVVRYQWLRSAPTWWWWSRMNDDVAPIIMYALHDINGDGVPELFIGGERGIAGIYTLRDGVPVSLLQAGWTAQLHLGMDTDGNNVITRWVLEGDRIYSLDENGVIAPPIVIKTTDRVWGFDEHSDTHYLYSASRVKYIDDERITLAEEEYAFYVEKFGLCGFSHRLEEFPPYRFPPRRVELEWMPILQ